MASQKTAILSVSDKTGLLELAKGLNENNVRIVASGGTAKAIRDAGIEVRDVADLTGAPEILGGRVKTLHPTVHGGLLARNIESDLADLAERKIEMIDFCVCNLYPFEKTVAKDGVTVAEAVEEIDIGGVTLLRAAAKNHSRVTILTHPDQYSSFLAELGATKGEISIESRQRFALKAFEMTAHYDGAISGYFRQLYAPDQHMPLRYGTNPHQKMAAAYSTGSPLPYRPLSGSPGYINLLDSLNAWALVKELKQATGLAAAASFKHVSPAGAAVGVPLSAEEKQVYMVHDIVGLDESPLACAYARARGADRVSSFGDIIALSDRVDVPTAKIISREVSDGVIAPGYDEAALEILKKKKAGKYLVLEIDPNYEPSSETETREVHGICLTQTRNTAKIHPESSFSDIVTGEAALSADARRDLTIAAIALKYTQSNSVAFAKNGQTIGIGAGQQSRIHVTRLAGGKADVWWLRFHPKCLGLKFAAGTKRPAKTNAIDLLCSGYVPAASTPTSDERAVFEAVFEASQVPEPFTAAERADWLAQLKGVSVVSDAFFPFTDNVYRAVESGVEFIAAPLGSQNDGEVIRVSKSSNITFAKLALRLFVH